MVLDEENFLEGGAGGFRLEGVVARDKLEDTELAEPGRVG